MSCSRLVGSIVLSFFLVTSLVANNIVTKNAKLGQDTEQSAEEGSFSNTGEDAILGTGTYMEGYNTAEEYQKVKNTDDVIKAGDPNHPKSVGPFKKGSLNENPLTFTNGAKDASDVIKAKNESDVIKSSTRSNTDNSISDGVLAVPVKKGEVLRKEGAVIKSNSLLNLDDNTHSPFKVNTRSESIVKGVGTKSKDMSIPTNLNYDKHSPFQINTRTESIIKNQSSSRDACDDCMAYCTAYVIENYGYTDQEAYDWCIATPDANFGCADTCAAGTTTTTGGYECPYGTVEDCSGDGDCCPESWIGDGFEDCEDQAFGCDLTCYGNDGGDCDADATTTTTTTGGDCVVIASYAMTFDWYCTGAYGSSTVDFCEDGTAILAGAYPGTWGFTTPSTFGDGLCAGGDLTDGFFFEFDNYATRYTWSFDACGYHDDLSYNGEGNADGVTMLIDYITDTSVCYPEATTTTTTTSGGGCPAGTVEDCSGDGDCCPESWIGDGFEDCEDQAFGCDLTCYDNDGGDCAAGTTTTTTTTSGYYGCPDGTVEDCSGDGDCCPASWIGDGFEDCEDQAFGCDLTCYDNDGGDCGGDATTTTGGGANLIWAGPATFDWGCYGYPGSATISFFDDGSADFGGYPGYWYQNTQTYDMPAGLCEGTTLTPTVIFNFSNYSVSYAWETSGNGYPSDPGCGIHDDYGSDGPSVDGTTSLNLDDPSVCYDGDTSTTTTTTTTTSGYYGCPDGTVEDCSGDGDCCPASWIGDGFEDCEDQAFGCDLTCYDNDGGDCPDGGTTTTTTGGGCPDGTVDDCSGDGDCCPESWIADGFGDCEDQQWGCDLTCYDNDGGDCLPSTDCESYGQVSCWDGECADSFEDCFAALGAPVFSEVITYDWGCTGTPGSTIMDVWNQAWPDNTGAVGFVYGDNLWVHIWNDWSGAEVTVPAGDYCPEWTAGTDWGFWFDVAPNVNYAYECADESNSVCDGRHSFDGWATVGGYSSSERINPDECPDGFVDDCAGDGDCCPESWIGDGFEDCEDQFFGCDLTCYDNDGGDCDGGGTSTTTTTTTGYGCPDGTVEDCSGDGDCCPESWIGDGFEDCEDQAFGCDLTCYNNDGNDCGDGPDPNDDLWNWYDMVDCEDGADECSRTYEFTYDWYCSGNPGTAQVTLLYDCSDPNSECNGGAAIVGGYEGFWSANPDGGTLGFADGLCPGVVMDWDFFFALDQIGVAYGYDMEGLGTDSIAGDGIHDDVFYNGNFNVDGWSSIVPVDGGGDEGCPDGFVEDCSGDGDCCAASWIGDGFEDCEDQAFGCDLTCYDNDGGDCGPDCAAGDINCDGSIDVVDVVNMVNAIIDGGTLDNGDINGDGSLDVVDVVLLVNYIIDGGARAMDADKATMTIADNSLRLSGNGYIGGVQMTLSHANGFELNLTENAMVSEYKTSGTTTTLVVVVPEEELLFTANQSFEVVNMIVANSEGEIEVSTVSEFGLTAAYPNPFNPSTTVTLAVPTADFVSVKVYNLVGQVVGVLAEGMMDANTYTFTWNAADMSSGVYLIRAESGSSVDIQKVLLVK